jgi:MoaA/NifB/PqqE/SkfB family radical SAM enzyme
MGVKVFWIDIVGTCNLRCPSCPVGNYREADFAGAVRRRGFMNFGYFREVLAKIERENPNDLCRIELYNWGEPLLHPEIAKIVAEVGLHDRFRCGISSNLSHKRMDLEGALQAHPYSFRISLSGFDRESYSTTHVRGDIDLVKSNMRRMREIIDRNSLKTIVSVAYHVYKHNAGRELEAMRLFCEELAFEFSPTWANFYPLEKIERYFVGDVSPVDGTLIDKLVLSPEEQLAAAKKTHDKTCRLQEHTTINHDGSVSLCCATFDPRHFIAPDFLEAGAEDLAKRRRTHSTCDRCIGSSYHSMICGYAMAEMDELGNRRVEFADGWRLSGNQMVRTGPEEGLA